VDAVHAEEKQVAYWEVFVMNIDTGEVIKNPRVADILKRLNEGERLVALNRVAKKSCKHCYGRGYEFVTPEGVHVPCRCTK
jgi:hypothetical protein